MKQAPLPPDESLRLAALASLDLLDTPPEERFDRITRLACRLFDVPIALVSLVDTDRQWFKSGEGFSVTETPRDIAFCGHTILDQRIMIVPDATVDARFADNPLVTGKDQIRFYAGCPLSAPDGSRVGAFCIKGREPRQLSDEDQVLLKGLAEMVETEIRVSDEVNRRTRAETESDEALIKAGVLDRAWAEIARMQQSEDLLNVLDGMLKDLVEADVVFDLCVINIIDEAAEERRQYGATPQGWCGQSDTPLSEVSRQFMTLCLASVTLRSWRPFLTWSNWGIRATSIFRSSNGRRWYFSASRCWSDFAIRHRRCSRARTSSWWSKPFTGS